MLLVALSIAVMAMHLLRGPNYVLDDWFNLRTASDPASLLGVDRDIASGRPGTLLAYGFTYTVIGNHPLLAVSLLALIHLATTVSLHHFLLRILPQRTAFFAVAIWVISPNHMSLEVWSSTVMIALSLLAMIVGADLAARPGTTLLLDVRSVVMFGLAALLYEASMPTIAFLAIVLPWITERRVRYRFVAMVGSTQLAIAVWFVSHWHESHASDGLVSLLPIVGSHVGHGLVGSRVLGTLMTAGFMVSVSVLCYRELPDLRVRLRQFRSDVTEPLAISIIGVSIVVAALGAAPFIFYYYTSLGPGDRVLYISSVASSVVLATILDRVVRAHRQLAVVCVVPILLAIGIHRWDKAADWDWAGDQGLAVLSTVHARFPHAPTEAIVVGPEPVTRGNIAPFIDHSNIRGAVAILYPGDAVNAYVAHDLASFEQFDAQHRFDLAAIAQVGDSGG